MILSGREESDNRKERRRREGRGRGEDRKIPVGREEKGRKTFGAGR